MGALLEERLDPTVAVPQRQAEKAIPRPPSCTVADTGVEMVKKRRLSEPLGSLGRKKKAQRGPLRAVLFDFDATLTSLTELQAHRLFPIRGGTSALDVAWLREKGFGGESRIVRLGETLQALAASGAELHIVSLADRGYIVRALAILGALHFFCNRIFGWEELGSSMSKAPFIKSLMEEKRWHRDEVLFVDDQEQNLQDARNLCLTQRTRGCGLCVEELYQLQRRVCEVY